MLSGNVISMLWIVVVFIIVKRMQSSMQETDVCVSACPYRTNDSVVPLALRCMTSSDS